MFNLAAGNIKLCRSNFTLRSDITPQTIEENLADVIFDRKKTNTQFLYYMIWVDIEPHEYIYAEVSFFDNKLQHIRLLPQHQSTSTSEKQVHSMDLLTAQNLARSWYRKYFSDEKMLFHGGRLHILMEQIQYIHLRVFSLNSNDKSNISRNNKLFVAKYSHTLRMVRVGFV